jgi:hypothetical protein
VAESATEAAVAHLAAHAAEQKLPTHLRSCQCGTSGCNWHRECRGAIVLVLIRQNGGRILRLVDVCTWCAAAISEATQVVEADPPPPAPQQAAPSLRRDRTKRLAQVEDTLRSAFRYLDVSLSGENRSAVLLLALLCILRAGRGGRATLSKGLLRGVRLRHNERDIALAALVSRGWLALTEPPPFSTSAPLQVRVADIAVGTPLASAYARRIALAWLLKELAAHRRQSCTEVRSVDCPLALRNLATAAPDAESCTFC